MYFVLFGAGSAMGPFELLMSLGANVIAIDINKPALWKRLIKITRKSSGKLIFPLSEPQISNSSGWVSSVAGCNLLTQSREIAQWLETVPGEELFIGTYVYLGNKEFFPY
jgi:hypothetical protein